MTAAEQDRIRRTLPPLLRRRHIYALGISKELLEKQITAGVLRPMPKLLPNQRMHFEREHVLEVLLPITDEQPKEHATHGR